MKRRDFIKYGAALAGFGGACLICRDFTAFTGQAADITNTFDTRPCRLPFEILDIQGSGNVYSCCFDFLKYKKNIGNITTHDFEELWNGEVLTDIRQRMLKGDFSMCKRDICSIYRPLTENELLSEYKKGPREIKISYDPECNYNCIKCRDEIKINSPEEMDLYDNVYLPKIVKICKNCKVVTLIGSGDPLFSRHTRKVMKTLVKEYPNIKFNILTNGLLLNEKNLNELGIQNNIHGAAISIDAVNKETYKKVMRTDGFDTVMKNVKLMSEWKKQGKIDWLNINFVVHLMNYKEMPAFAKLAQELDVMALFTTYRPLPSAEYHKRYNEVAVFEPTNKHYKEFAKIMKDPVFKDSGHCLLDPKLTYLANLQT